MFVIRTAGPDDVDRVVELQIALFHEDAGVHDARTDLTWPQREGHADISALLDSEDATVLVAVADEVAAGFVAGYAAARPATRQAGRSAVLRSLYVTASQRRAGAGSALIGAFTEWAKGAGCSEVMVDHYAANGDAGRLYESLGFVAQSVSRSLPLNED
ncbi:MAG: GNAT family N-acetyltransferase [Actinomycetota bacterium]